MFDYDYNCYDDNDEVRIILNREKLSVPEYPIKNCWNQSRLPFIIPAKHVEGTKQVSQQHGSHE